MRDWLNTLSRMLPDAPVAIVTVMSAEGSTPRETGARMLVSETETIGTIGGGALEYTAIAKARALLRSRPPWTRQVMEVPLGPAVQQCCGGYVTLLVEVLTSGEAPIAEAMSRATGGLLVRPTSTGVPWRWFSDRHQITDLPLPVASQVRAMLSGRRAACTLTVTSGETSWLIEPIQPPRVALYLYGAGHVAREVVSVLDGLDFAITWIDVSRARFPDLVARSVDVAVTEDPATVARTAPPDAFHAVMTFSHALDEEITAVLLEQNTFGYLGLIGSKTKRARFLQRFRRAGICEPAIARLTCPIGLPGVPGKEPRAIAIALAAELLKVSAMQQETQSPEADRANDGSP